LNTFEIGGAEVEPGSTVRLEIPVMRLVTQTEISIPVVVVHGEHPGPRLWLSAALHGDELNGTEIVRRVLARVRASRLSGTLVAVPVVNMLGFVVQSRYLPDRRDLNRSFPPTTAPTSPRCAATSTTRRCGGWPRRSARR
jgi:predicted deacylase